MQQICHSVHKTTYNQCQHADVVCDLAVVHYAQNVVVHAVDGILHWINEGHFACKPPLNLLNMTCNEYTCNT